MESSFLVRYNSKYKEILHRLILEHVRGNPHCFILDVGCRWGDDLCKIVAVNADTNIFGIDTCFDALKVASRKLEKARNVNYVLQAKGEASPFRNNSFDIIISSEVIEHIERVEEFIKEVYRVLKNQGVFIISTPSRFNYVSLIGKIIPHRFKKFLRKFVYYLPQGRDENPHVREYTPGELKELFKKNGFEVKYIIGGVLRVPLWPLFERFSFLVLIWKCLDRFIDKFPGGINLKHNFVMEAEKIIKKQ